MDINFFTNSPLFEPILPALLKFESLAGPPTIEELNKILTIEHITFVPQAPKSSDFSEAYEPRIFLNQEVQTREHSWHDFFNALVWHRFSQTKRVINSLHYHLQKSHYPSKHRLPTENMLTLFDESGAIVIADDLVLLDLIREHRWHELFWQKREYIKQHLKVLVFGHGLYEKALRPYIGLTAQCLLFDSTDICSASADAMVAEFLKRENTDLSPKNLRPLPILGLPGWWAHNNKEEFYTNRNYFRPAALTMKLSKGASPERSLINWLRTF